MTNIFVSEFSEFSEKHLGKTLMCCKLKMLVPLVQFDRNLWWWGGTKVTIGIYETKKSSVAHRVTRCKSLHSLFAFISHPARFLRRDSKSVHNIINGRFRLRHEAQGKPPVKFLRPFHFLRIFENHSPEKWKTLKKYNSYLHRLEIPSICRDKLYSAIFL